ncbi:ABC transporter permease [Devosia sp. ZB163]|nr:ABC transporter permease [Devosia sp. ZB163]MDC9823124.1 ABC transporter permease [Devosia sp. ZB163]
MFQRLLAAFASGFALLALIFDFASTEGAPLPVWEFPVVGVFLVLALLSLARFRLALSYWIDGGLAALGAIGLIMALDTLQQGEPGYWFALVSAWLFAWLFAERLSSAISADKVREVAGVLIPVVFGLTIVVAWEAITRGGNVPKVLLPSPSGIWTSLIDNIPKIAADFQQTFLKAVLAGYVLGCGAGFLVAIAIDRSPFLKRGLLPLGNFISALPLIGIAPIMVMWFGFDWPSKAAVVVIMTFFPMLVNTVAGLNVAGHMERDLMRTYASGYWSTLFKLRLPAAAPFIFNALKINSTLALIGAIVAEFFGTPIVGMGFRISSEIGKLNVEMVWAEIAVAALAGSVFYWVVALIERAVTFWHPSVRGGRA